jgi:NADPH:quinone reductase-like Zn-dependent oxidoreductase
VSAVHGSRRIRTFSANPDTAILDDLTRYVDSGALRPVVSGVFPLTGIADAHQAFSRGGTLGKHVINVAA